MITLLNEDNMAVMARYPDKYFDLAIVDPPYGININMNMGRRKGMGKKHNAKKWDSKIPTDEYFNELFRVSKNQIVWGANYFNMPPNRGFIIWDKMTPEDLSFAMCEFAWTSFDKAAKIFRKPIQTDNNNRIHPTQKPVKLYQWIYHNYAKPEYKIIDTHLGSGSNAIAAHYFGIREFIGCEIDLDYYQDAVKRFKLVTSQTALF